MVPKNQMRLPARYVEKRNRFHPSREKAGRSKSGFKLQEDFRSEERENLTERFLFGPCAPTSEKYIG